jgi:hypothetical protein
MLTCCKLADLTAVSFAEVSNYAGAFSFLA